MELRKGGIVDKDKRRELETRISKETGYPFIDIKKIKEDGTIVFERERWGSINGHSGGDIDSIKLGDC